MKHFGRRFVLALSFVAIWTQMCAASALLFPAPGTTNSEPWPRDVPIRLCAIRVEFAVDNVSGTTGNGQMESGFSDSLRIDPKPHDRAYFEDHLAFLQNYYSTVSKGAVSFSERDVYPATDTGAYLLGNPMWHYNYNTDDGLLNRRLVELFVEATQLAAGEVDFTAYDAIVIFHAGTGKDFNFGYDATPFDIPSAYISEQDIQSFPGSVPLGVTRGLILPEGENQQEALDFGVELSLNGIMVKLFGNWLGLPDLFNTQSGQSGVGRWGMMDQGSGNLGALVPAMPDAWSRVYMRWQDEVTIPPSPLADSLRVNIARFGVQGAPEIVKLPVTPREYYLVENRDADADSIGYVELRDRDGRIMRSYLNDDLGIEPGFKSAVSASHYDFGIPGSGLLIWHIDEDVIQAGLSANQVNVDARHRGVDLVEADAAQDIGEEYGFASPGSGAELGVPEDAWYAGNDAHRAANHGALQVRFTDGGYPSARLYDGAFTYYELTNFSPVDSVMSFRLLSTAVAKGFPVALSERADWAAADLDGDGYRELYLASRDSLYMVDSTGMTGIATLPAGVAPSTLQARDIDGDGREEIVLEGNNIGVVEQVDSEVTLRLASSVPSGSLRVYPARSTDSSSVLLVTSSPLGDLPPLVAFLYDLNLNRVDSFLVFQGSVSHNDIPQNMQPLPATDFVFVRDGEAIALQVSDSGFVEIWRIQDDRIQLWPSVLREPARTSVFLPGFGYVDALTGDLLCAYPSCIAPDVDWDQDGIPDGGGISGASGVAREDAPQVNADTAWVMDVNVNGDPDIIGLHGAVDYSDQTRYTRWIAAKHFGGLFAGFPMAISNAEPRKPFTWTPSNNLYCVSEVVDSAHYYYSVVKLPVLAGQGSRFAFQDDVGIINVGELRPQVHAREDWLYCWPNPTNDVSHIRVTAAYPARATAKIFDLSGRQVAELTGSSNDAGALEMLWDVSKVESGIYVGSVTLSGDGQNDQAQVKIAVVK